MFLSLLGQFAIHLVVMMYTVAMTKPHLPADFTVRAFMSVAALAFTHRQPNIEGKFEPNLINSAVFLVTCIQQVCQVSMHHIDSWCCSFVCSSCVGKY